MFPNLLLMCDFLKTIVFKNRYVFNVRFTNPSLTDVEINVVFFSFVLILIYSLISQIILSPFPFIWANI